MPTLKEKIENHPVPWFLGAILAGFLAGIGTYEGALKLTDRQTIGKEYLAKLHKDLKDAKNNAATQRWLKIRGLEGLNGYKVRIIARVNGFAFSYPSRTIWTEARPVLPTESFPLPSSKDGYRVSFEILSLDREGEFKQFTNQEVLDIRNFPTDSSYKIFGISQEQWGTVRGGSVCTDPTGINCDTGSLPIPISSRILFELR